MVILVNSLRARFPRPIHLQKIFRSGNALFSSMSTSVDEDYNDFLQWLERKAGTNISSKLSIGKSPCGGMGAFASENIKKGDRILKIPFSVQLTRDNLPPEVTSLLGNNIDPVTNVALLILHEKNLGQDSEWAPYISRLPLPHDMHSSVFWSDQELEMIRPSCVYEETLRHKKLIERDFVTVKSVFDRFPNTTLEEFTYAYQLVKSRAWKSRKRGVSLIPFADLMNHANTSEAHCWNDERQQHSEIIADRDFAAGEEVVIRYGKYANATLLMSFGFTIPHNVYDFGLVKVSSMAHGKQVFSSDQILGFSPSWNDIKINEVRSMEDIPVSLRAFARVLVSGTQQDIRAGRYPLENKGREIAAHQLLHDEISKLIENHEEHIKLLEPGPCEKSVVIVRRQLALDLLEGELRVLKSACAWLEDYCLMLRAGVNC